MTVYQHTTIQAVLMCVNLVLASWIGGGWVSYLAVAAAGMHMGLLVSAVIDHFVEMKGGA